MRRGDEVYEFLVAVMGGCLCKRCNMRFAPPDIVFAVNSSFVIFGARRMTGTQTSAQRVTLQLHYTRVNGNNGQFSNSLTNHQPVGNSFT